MGCIFKNIIATQFLLEVFNILMNYNIFMFEACCSIYKSVMVTFMGLDLTFDPFFTVKWGWYFQCPLSPLLPVLQVWDVETAFRKSCAPIFLWVQI